MFACFVSVFFSLFYVVIDKKKANNSVCFKFFSIVFLFCHYPLSVIYIAFFSP